MFFGFLSPLSNFSLEFLTIFLQQYTVRRNTNTSNLLILAAVPQSHTQMFIGSITVTVVHSSALAAVMVP